MVCYDAFKIEANKFRFVCNLSAKSTSRACISTPFHCRKTTGTTTTSEYRETIVEWAFGKRMTAAERLRKHQRSLEKTQRELDRERVKLENQEKKLIAEIKKSAKNGQMGACKIQAKDLVRTRRYIEKFYSMRTQLQAISLRIQTVRTNEQMMQAMKGATGVLGSMNRSMNLPALQRIAMEFEKENDIMDQRQEMMDDAIDDVTGLEDEAEGEEVVEQVLEEIGIDLKNAMGETPQGLQSQTVTEGRVAQAIGGGGAGADPGDNDLQARLDSLRR
ncbi:Snf7-domain-containing protein [Hyaloscypha bicolor E]|uniref:Snf7-domain-containing protein n=1 Tax=Hyaloscypha bicolor E TaxID=1095630 RepID=A0A2J6T8G7_9HELO|nr:Snf7-domain-containing protein [Hyaloscypha bicolor E]PMD59305.1 Snf7-domain-containing protein [Hyaloscypha bicolor E]